MSTDQPAVESAGADGGAESRQSNLNKSVNSAPAEKPESERDGAITATLAEFVARYPGRADLPVARDHGRSIRRDYAHSEREEWVEEQPDAPQFEIERPATGTDVTDVTAYTWGEAVRELLTAYRRTEETTVHLERGKPGGPDHATHDVSAENRWFVEYQKRYAAQLDAWLRELTGGERPSGGETGATFDEPRIVLITRSASSRPDGERLGPVDHADALREAWEPTYHTLRNTLRAEGYTLGADWQYDRRLEPHTGKRGSHGTNECYAHEHIILVVDGDVTADDLRPVVEKHVEECDPAGADAHGEEAIEVREPSELNDPAAYVADYCSIDPVPLPERDPDYVAWAAAMTAGNIRTVSRSESAAAAATADACKQRAESGESDQEVTHGEEVVRSNRAGYAVECRECGSPHGIDQDQTLAGHRLSDGPTAAADGGTDVRGCETRETALRDRWRDARAAAQVGEPATHAALRDRLRSYMRCHPDADCYEAARRVVVKPGRGPVRQLVVRLAAEVEAGIDPDAPVSVERPPEWEVVAVTVAGETHGCTAGSGVEMVEVRDPVSVVEDEIPDGWTTCDCGTEGRPSDMAVHLVEDHGIEDPERAGSVVARQTRLPGGLGGGA